MPAYSRDSILCDSSSLISITESCFLPMLSALRMHMRGDFLLPERVRYECIDHPLNLKEHTLAAVRMKQALNEGVLVPVEKIDIIKRREDVQWLANNSFFMESRPLKLMHDGESEMLALALELGVSNILIDERTTRLLAEDPYALHSHMESEFGRKIAINENYLKQFRALTSNLNIFRSSELLAVAYEHGFFKPYKNLERHALEAALYGLKFAGCGISFDEIEEYLRSLR